MPKTRMESSVRIAFFKPQSATGTLCLKPIPKISHLDVFNFKPEYFEQMLKLLMISLTEEISLTKKFRVISIGSQKKIFVENIKLIDIRIFSNHDEENLSSKQRNSAGLPNFYNGFGIFIK